MTAEEMLLSAVGAASDPNSGGRQMPSHWGHKKLNIVSNSSPTGTQFLQAVGSRRSDAPREAARASPTASRRTRSCSVSTGDGTTSEGEFWESLNNASNLKLPVVYLVEDNGYAISVPVEVNTAGGSISKLVASFPGPLRRGSRRLRPHRQLRGAAARGRLRAQAQGSGARAREGHSSVLALAVRRRGDVPPGRGARRRRGARSGHAVPEVARRRRPRDRGRDREDPGRGRGRGARRDRRRACAAEQPGPRRSTTSSTRPTSIRRASSSTPKTIRSSRATRRRWWICSTRA